jgi:tRNA-dihydrouridine synthase A
MVAYARRECAEGTRLHHISRHLLGLYHGQPGARAWRRALTLGVARAGTGPDLLLAALTQVHESGETTPPWRRPARERLSLTEGSIHG